MNFFDDDPFGGAGPAGLFAQFAQAARRAGRPNPRSYDEYFKAYSVGMMPGRPRDNVSYGGKIIMPPSALANLSSMELESTWMFKLRNPANPAASTHAGVLEFIAEEGCVHLPHWMMKTLRLDEGDPIRITGCELQKGKMVKLQAQTVHFLEISDPKAVLEQALRNFSALTQGDIIEISYNGIVFGLLVMETQPGGEGISVLDTDLEVDFAAPVGYVEPERPKPPPQSTMASKLNIDVSSSTPNTSRPSSSMAGAFVGAAPRGQGISKGGDQWESFKGKGETLAGRKTKGKGVSHRKAEEAPEGSKIIRTDKHRIVTNSSLENDVYVPAPLNLPFGKLFFGFNVQTYVPPSQDSSGPLPQSNTFAGSGNTLSGGSTQASSSTKGKGREQPSSSWGSGGQTLGGRPSQPSQPHAVGAGGASVPVLPNRDRQQQDTQDRSPSPDDYGVDDDDDVYIDYDSD